MSVEQQLLFLITHSQILCLLHLFVICSMRNSFEMGAKRNSVVSNHEISFVEASYIKMHSQIITCISEKYSESFLDSE